VDSNVNKKWEGFLDPEVLRPKLISASIFLAAYDLLCDTIIGRIKDFYSIGFDENGAHVDPKYKQKVLSRNRSPLYASLLWLKENDAIDDNDLAEFERLKESRNRVAHELAQMVCGVLPSDFLGQFPSLLVLINKIEVWWIVNVEIDTNPDMDGKKIDESGIVPGKIMILQMMVEVALGSEEEANYYINEFRKRAIKP
jgi:hypothetical protein